MKHRDIPVLIEKGILDYGITSDEWLEETGAQLLRIKELDWCDTSIYLIVHKDSFGQLKNCVSEYVNIARRYFKDNEMEIEYVSGSCEALVPTEFDCCIGCVESGVTLSQNDLIVRETLLQSKIVLVGKEKINSHEMKMIYEKI